MATKAAQKTDGSEGTAGLDLSREATRLLRALEGGGTYAIADPVAEGTVIVRQESAGVSLGGGRFPISAADELVRRDLVEPSGAGAGRRFCISRVGVARRRRQAAPPDLAFPAQHQDLIRARIAFEGRSAAVTLDASESPLDWLRRRKDASGAPLIDEACHQAGERLRLDLTLAAMLPRVTANWDAAVSDKARGAPRDPASSTDSAVAARQRVVRALEAVGSDFADLLIDLCGFLTGLAEIERARGWPVRSGKVIARIALARLADHYGLAREARGPARSRGVTAWRSVAPP
jgi:Domain of unknown function (DUF6456)